jgi:hypothetical protein
MIRLLTMLMGLAFLIGCGPKIEMLTDPISISGKLTTGGAPLGGVSLTLQPLETGHPTQMQVGADGSFSGKVIPGKYTYFVSANEMDPTAIDKVGAKFRDADMTRTITISADKPTVDIALD